MRKVDRFEKTIDTLEYTYQRIVDNLPVGVVGVDNEKNVVLWNNLMEEMFNIKEIDILDKSIVNIFLTDPNKRTISEFIEKLKKDSSVQEVEEFHYKDSDGNNKVFLVLGYVLREDTARVGGSILVFRDITENFNFEEKLRFAQEIKEQELKSKVNIATRELQNANVELKKLNHLKSEFVSVVSHELRTPLTSIRGYASLLITERLGKLTPQQKESLSIMKEEGERLSNIINDLLDLSKLEAGKTDLHFENGDLAEQLKGVLSALEVQAHSKKIRLSISGKRKLIAQFDKEKMRQVFFNIIGNAIKYTLDSGKVTVSLKEDKTYAIIEVKDTGVGIAKKDIKRIFEPFAQAESHLKRSVPGSGLGLSISKHMIDMHHGEIKVTSKVGKGSVFALYIPKKQELEVKNEHSSKNADISNELRTNSKRKK
jgi:PAS domain S-box-containing protein